MTPSRDFVFRLDAVGCGVLTDLVKQGNLNFKLWHKPGRWARSIILGDSRPNQVLPRIAGYLPP